MSKRILIVTGDAGESYEVMYGLHRFREAGMGAVVAAPSKRRLHLVMHDFEEGWDTYVERPGYGVEADLALAEAKVEDFDAILLPGGRAPEYLRNHADVIRLVQEFDRAGKWIFALCHGVQILSTAKLVSHRTVTCFEHCRWDVESSGGRWDSRQAVRDGRLVTAQTWQSHAEFYRLVFECLNQG